MRRMRENYRVFLDFLDYFLDFLPISVFGLFEMVLDFLKLIFGLFEIEKYARRRAAALGNRRKSVVLFRGCE